MLKHNSGAGGGGADLRATCSRCPGFVTPGEQLLFQLPNNKLLTTKIGLLSALRERARVVSKTSKPAPCPQDR